ncbi:uncharacterized protein LOC115316122 [Ixodes scapularis]|uniref:uncharacterized protein LOC115316122 n=1 Tax=Ixodes scapularis TaxID=6945 RepID=UPI001A9ED231|nr:uncharacterized protein LOC115316122 [Ixodes scapularis]
MITPLFVIQIALLMGSLPPSLAGGTNIEKTDNTSIAAAGDNTRAMGDFSDRAFFATSVRLPRVPPPLTTNGSVRTDQGVTKRPSSATSSETTISATTSVDRFSGCGGQRSRMITPLFVIQVSGKRHYGLKSDALCLIVLPHPQRLLCIASECLDVVCYLLLVSGDIESNPGPITLNEIDKTLHKLLERQQDIVGAFNEIKSNQRKVEARMTGIEKCVESFKNVETKIDACSTTMVTLKQTIGSLENKVDDLENRMRRNNLVFFGIPESQNETKSDLEQAVVSEILRDKLDIENAEVERLHRIGKPSTGKPRPVIMKLREFNVKENILKNARRLKGTRISISEDFSFHIREKRKLLWNSSKKERDKGEEVILKYDKLILGNSCYQWDTENNTRLLISTTQRTAREGSLTMNDIGV